MKEIISSLKNVLYQEFDGNDVEFMYEFNDGFSIRMQMCELNFIINYDDNSLTLLDNHNFEFLCPLSDIVGFTYIEDIANRIHLKLSHDVSVVLSMTEL